jgi:hypothetical protein
VLAAVEGGRLFGIFREKNAIAGNIHARLLIVVPVNTMPNATVEDIAAAENSRTAMLARITAIMLLATSAAPAVLNGPFLICQLSCSTLAS